MRQIYQYLSVITLILAVTGAAFISAQDDGTVIGIQGTVEAIDGTTVIISGLPVNIGTLDFATATQIAVGANVDVEATTDTGIISVTTLIIIEEPIDGLEITGIVQSFEGTTITIGGLPIDVSTIDFATATQISVGVEVVIVGEFSGDIVVSNMVVVDDDETPNDDDDVDTEATLNAYNVAFIDAIFDGTNTTFTYVVTGTGAPPALSHFNLGIPTCANGTSFNVVSVGPNEAVEFGTDPTTGVDGIKWDFPVQEGETQTYTITFEGEIAIDEIPVAVKDGDGAHIANLAGPSCEPPEAAPEATEAPIEATAEATAELTPEATPEATAELTPEATAELTPEATQDLIDNDVIVVIEGPVQAINVNVIVIYNIEIELETNNPVLTVIQIGDVIRVEGELDDDADTLVIVNIINFTFISVEVNINYDLGIAFRNDSDCGNLPPPWAPANGWRARCQGDGGGNSDVGRGGGRNQGGNPGGGNPGGGNPGNNDNDNDDNDDDD